MRWHLPPTTARRSLCAATAATVVLLAAVPWTRTVAADGAGAVTDPGCTPGPTITGADYQRSLVLDDGRTMWLLQDAFVSTAGRTPQLVHNAGVVVDGSCAAALIGASGTEPWIAADHTDPYDRWYWPMGAYQRDAATAVVFVAEMREEGDHYLDHAVPVATWTVEIDLDELTAGELRPAPDPGDGLYGWSVVPDGEWLYLYGYCNRQFGWSTMGHDPCTQSVRLARVPLAAPAEAPTYWDGRRWTGDARQAVDVSPDTTPWGARRTADPMQVMRADDGSWLAVTKVDDWWGPAVVFDVAASPAGPWTTTASVPVAAIGLPTTDRVNTYFASFAPAAGDELSVALSRNCWTEPGCDEYRPVVLSAPRRLWTPREAVAVGGALALPLGPQLDLGGLDPIGAA